MRVIFVGMHNKPGMKPLDSRTMTGQVIDKIIAGLSFDCVKTNLCECEYMPKKKEIIQEHNYNWYEKYSINQSDLIVLLGTWVCQNFMIDGCNLLKLGHPAGVYGHANKEQYIKRAIEKINSYE